VICTGNVGNRETVDWLKGLSDKFSMVKGEFDHVIKEICLFIMKKSVEAKSFQKIKLGLFDVGIIHGH